MATERPWTGEAACLLQRAMRLTNQAFADHLGVSVRTVAGWHERPERTPANETQQILDTALERAKPEVRELFANRPEESEAAKPANSVALADAERRLNEDRHIGAALEWLDLTAGWQPGTARRKVVSRFAETDVGSLRDRSVHRARVNQRRVAEVLRDYYAHGGSVDGYATYAVTVDGDTTVTTGIVTCPDWLDLDCSLTPQADRLRFSASAPIPETDLGDLGETRAVDRLAETLAIGTRLIDLPLYFLTELDVRPGQVAGRMGVTRFAHFGLTLDLLEGELLNAIAAGTNEFPLRDKYLPDLQSIVNYSGRLCAGGAVGVCAIARPAGPHGEPDYLLLAQERSGHVVNAARRLALTPKGFHQPLADYREDARIRVTLLREMEEELFGREDVDTTDNGDQRSADPMHPSRLSEPMTWLLEHPERLRLDCTGVGFNVVNGNYELACLIVIDDEEFWSRYGGLIEANWEASRLRRYSSQDRESLAELVTDDAWTVEGPFALTQGLRRLVALDGDRVDLPDLAWQLV